MRIEDRRKVLLQDPQKFPPDMRGESKYGPVHGVELFKVFATKQEASDARIHRAPRAGIAGSSLVKGAQSIALSGRYEDDIDNGDIIFYTGTGGQEVLSARDKARGRIPRQEVPQTFANQLNAALRVNKELGTPVRVLRGANKHSPYAPSEGYRYDGCYLVQTAEIAVGRSGFNICRYKLTRRIEPNDGPIPINPNFTDEIVSGQAPASMTTVNPTTSSQIPSTTSVSNADAGPSKLSNGAPNATVQSNHEAQEYSSSTPVEAGADVPLPPLSPAPSSPPTSAHPSPIPEVFSPDFTRMKDNTVFGSGDIGVSTSAAGRPTTIGRGRTTIRSSSRSDSRPRSATRPFMVDTSQKLGEHEIGSSNTALSDSEDEVSEILPVGEGMSVRRFSENKGKKRDDGKGHKRMKSG